MQSRPKISLKATLESGVVRKLTTRKKRRATAWLQRVNRPEFKKYEVVVTYGVIVDVFGDKVLAQNDGEYTQFRDVFYAYQIFTEAREIRAILEP